MPVFDWQLTGHDGGACAAAVINDFQQIVTQLRGQCVDLIPQGSSAPPDLDVEHLMTLLAGLLGFGGMRSFEKSRGVAQK